MMTTVPHNAPSTKIYIGRKLEDLLGELRNLPLMPATAQQAMALANEENASAKDLSALLERDVALASSILKLANSPVFNWGHAIESLNAAVVRLGLRECQNLILAVSMRNVFSKTDPATKGLCAVLWQHCFLTATLCRRLSRVFRLNYQGEEFAAGLLHDLGRILLAITIPDEFQRADPMDFLEDSDIQHRESQVLGTDHCQLGNLYAEHNGLPRGIQSVIRFHHQHEDDPDHRELSALVAMADHMANYLQRREDPQAYDVNVNPGFAYLCKGWSSEKKDALTKTLPVIMTETINAAAHPTHPKSPRR
ncbi:MAG TPA: HDOD domain-containing protein [Gemmataceae bacterium]|nr:HDOD domain-containing protein [Gemmataceae bacterium]